MISWVAGAFIKSFFILLTLLFVNRFLKFDSGWVNPLERGVAQGADWLRAHNLNLKNNFYSLAALLGLALLVNWYAGLDNPLLNSIGWEILAIFQSDAWNNLIPALDSITKLLIYAVMMVALNRFFKLQVDVVENMDRWLCDILDRLILSHGGLFELVSKNAMTLIVAMLVNHHAQINFAPLTILQERTISFLGLEGLGEGSAARRKRQMCQREMDTIEMRRGLLLNAITTAEANGQPEAAVRLRNSLDNLREEAVDCQAELGMEAVADEWDFAPTE